MSVRPRILQLGLPWNYHKFPQETRQLVRTGLARGMEKMESAGFRYTVFEVTPEEGVQSYIDYLKKNPVDGVVFGAGLRRIEDMYKLLEQLINATKTHAPKSPIIFNEGPATALEATLRHFPHPKGERQGQ